MSESYKEGYMLAVNQIAAAEVEIRALREQLRIATEALTTIVEGQYQGAAPVAEDALIQMSVVG